MKVSIEDFRLKVMQSDESQVVCIKAQLLKEFSACEKMIDICNAQLDFWDLYNFKDITRLARSLEIEPPQASD